MLNFLRSLKTDFHVIILTEIGSRNLTVVENDETDIVLDCDCVKCELESLFVEFMFNVAMYTVGGIYRHRNVNVSHFVSALECVLHKIDTNRTTILAGDINIDIV